MSIGSVIRAGFQVPKGWGIWTSAGLGVIALGAIGSAAAYFIHTRSTSDAKTGDSRFNPRKQMDDLRIDEFQRMALESIIKKFESDDDIEELLDELNDKKEVFGKDCEFDELITYVEAEKTRRFK